LKPKLVILNGWAAPEFVWNDLKIGLEEQFDVHLIGWKQSELLINEILELTENERFVLVGWSLGAMEAIRITLKLQSLVSKLILIGSTSRFIVNSNESNVIGWHSKIIKRMQEKLETDSETTLTQFYDNVFSESDKKHDLYKEFWQLYDPMDIKQLKVNLIAGLQALIDYDLRDGLSMIECPSLIIHGKDDTICPVEAGCYVDHQLQNSSCHILNNTGHMPFYIKSDECLKIINSFIGDDNDQ